MCPGSDTRCEVSVVKQSETRPGLRVIYAHGVCVPVFNIRQLAAGGTLSEFLSNRG